MPFKSAAQRRWMWKEHPEIAARWEEHTPPGKLPRRVRRKQRQGGQEYRKVDEVPLTTELKPMRRVAEVNRRRAVRANYDLTEHPHFANTYVSVLKSLNNKEAEHTEAKKAVSTLRAMERNSFKRGRGPIYIPKPDKLGYYPSHEPDYSDIRRATRANTGRELRKRTWAKIASGAKEFKPALNLESGARTGGLDSLQKKKLLGHAVASLPFAPGQVPLGRTRGNPAGVTWGKSTFAAHVSKPNARERKRNAMKSGNSYLRMEDVRNDPTFKIGDGFQLGYKLTGVVATGPQVLIKGGRIFAKPLTRGNKLGLAWMAAKPKLRKAAILTSGIGAGYIGRKLANNPDSRIGKVLRRGKALPGPIGSLARGSDEGQREALEVRAEKKREGKVRRLINAALRRHDVVKHSLTTLDYARVNPELFEAGRQYFLGGVGARLRQWGGDVKDWVRGEGLHSAVRGATHRGLEKLHTHVGLPPVTVDLEPVRTLNVNSKFEGLSTLGLNNFRKKLAAKANLMQPGSEPRKALERHIGDITAEVVGRGVARNF